MFPAALRSHPRFPARLVALVALLGAPFASCQCDEDFGVARLPGTVRARLCHPVSGQPAPGQTLEVEAKGNTLSATSDANGKAELANVPAGEITLRVIHRVDGAAPQTDRQESMTLSDGQTVELLDGACIDFPLAPGKGGIQGQVCNRHTGRLLGGAAMVVTSNAGEEHRTTTDQGGYFALDEVSEGDHLLTVTGDGFQRSYPVHVEAGEVTRLELGGNCRPFDPSNTGVVEGRLCATNGTGPWALALATIRLNDGSTLQDLTDVEGHFLIEGVPPGEHTLEVRGGGESMTLQATVTSGQTTLLQPQAECPVPPRETTGDVRGQLCDPLVGGWLVGATARTVQDGREYLDHTDEAGRFHLAGLQPGNIHIDVDKGELHRDFDVPIMAGQTVTVADGVCVPPTGECRDEQLQITDAAPLRVLLVVDKSGSMADDLGTMTRWDAAVDALREVTTRLDQDAAFGLVLFPAGNPFLGCDSPSPPSGCPRCEAGIVAVEPAVGNAALISEALASTGPGGGTPIGPTMSLVRDWLVLNPSDTTTLVLLATDGAPNCNASLDPSACNCPDTPGGCWETAELCLDDGGTISAISDVAGQGVRTYVVGLPGITDTDEFTVQELDNVLKSMATAGGTNAGNGTPYYHPENAQELTQDMTDIVLHNRACRFVIEDAPNDPALVEVTLDGVVVQRDPARRAGWDLVGERGVELYGAPCEELQRGTEHDVVVHYCVD
ncbi:MAG: carboxypeptidase regulatory-like domain-containing protein [Myxococcota bacterium]